MRIFNVIISSKKNMDLRVHQNSAPSPLPYRYFIGDPTLKNVIEKGNIVYLPCKNGEDNLAQKSLLAFKWINDNILNFDYILKTEDNIPLNRSEIEIVLKKLYEKRIDYADFLLQSKTQLDEENTYWLSQTAIKKLVSINSQIFKNTSIADILKTQSLLPKNISLVG